MRRKTRTEKAVPKLLFRCCKSASHLVTELPSVKLSLRTFDAFFYSKNLQRKLIFLTPFFNSCFLQKAI